jgi:SecD/SecF fusion protein
MKLAALLPTFSAVSLLAVEGTESSWLAPFNFAVQFARLGPWVTVPVVLLLAIALPFFLGWLWAKAVRMPTYAWRIGLILCTIFASVVTIGLGWPPKLGVDLKGGWIMIYEIDYLTDEAKAQPVPVTRRQMSDDTSPRASLIQKLKQRLNPDGLKEISIRPYGLEEIEIIVPETDPAEIAKLKRQIQEQGVLEFLILAEAGKDQALFDAARAQQNDPVLRNKRAVLNPSGVEIGRWVIVGRDDKPDPQLPAGVRPLRINREGGSWREYLIRNPATGELLDSSRVPTTPRRAANYFHKLDVPTVEILTKVHETYRVTGNDLRQGGLQSSLDESGRPQVNFAFKAASASKMAGLTAANIGRQLAISLDDTVLSHANIRSQISDSGRITGRFTTAEVEYVIRILKAGSLPAKPRDPPVYEDPADPTLGAENIRQGSIAVIGSLALVFLFCLWYYRFAGVVACIALLMNILLTVAVMILFGATLTMPGLAGLVLTIGMAVDSNVLIFERMRDELDKGASLRMAIRNGYDRAMVTIIDSNLTTLLTAIILYIIGTDQLVGFAVTLTLGLIISMFTAVFCTRVIFEVAERTGWLRSLQFKHFFTTTKFDFVRYMGYAAAFSIILIGIGLAAAVWRGGGIFDIDLRGGSSVQVTLNTPLSTAKMSEYMDKAFDGATYEGSRVEPALKPVGRPAAGGMHSTFRIDTIYTDVKVVQDRLMEALQDDSGNSLITHYATSYAPPAVEKGASWRIDLPTYFTALTQNEDEPEEKAAEAEQAAEVKAPADDKPVAEKAVDEKPADEKSEPEDAASAAPLDNEGGDNMSGAGKTEPPTSDTPRVTSTLKIADSSGTPEPIAQETLLKRVEAAADKLKIANPKVEVTSPSWDHDPGSQLAEWDISLATSPEDAERIMQHVSQQLNSEPVWPASKTIGGQIAGDFVKIAIGALVASVIGIILYIWFRFQNVTWGFAAVVALVHDVLFMLAGIAVSYWLQGGPTFEYFTGLTEFKIDLTVIAAFLTLIGYSINDTIVIFDRMREIKGKLPTINRQIVNDSVNQTLSRSILTFLTVFLTVVVLYYFGGPGIHGFAYAMLIGTVVGMYSTVFIAAPFLLWMLNRNAPAKKAT